MGGGARRDVTETVEYRGQTSPAELSSRDRARGESGRGRSWRDTPPSRPSGRAAGRGDRSRGVGFGGGGRAGARAPAQRPPSRFPAQHGGTGVGKRLPQRARGRLRGARRSPRGVPRPPGRIGRSLRPDARRSPAGEVPGPALRRRGDAAARGPPVRRSEPADPLSGRPHGVLRRHPEHGRGDGAAAGCDRSLHGDRGPEDGQRGSRPPPGGPPRGARQRLLAPRPDGRGVHPEARRGAGPRDGNPVARGACPRRAAPAVGGTARRQRGDLRLLPSRLPGPVHGGSRRPRSRDPSLGRAGVRSLGDLPGPRDRGRRHGTARGRRGAGRPPHRSHPPGRGRVVHPAARGTGPAAHVRLAAAPALGDRRGAVARGQRRPLPREDPLVRAPGKGPGRDRRASRAGPAHRDAPRRAAQPDRGAGRPRGGRAALPHGRRLHARLGVLEAPRRLLRLRVSLLSAHDRVRGGGVRAAAGPARRDRPGGGPRNLERARRGGPGRREPVAARVPHPGGGRAGALDGPRLLARDGRGRDVPGCARVEPGRDREEAVGGAAAQGPGRDRAAARAARGRQHLPAGAGGAGAGLREDHRRAATSCATSSPASSRWRPRRAPSSSRARRASGRSSSPTRSTA